MASPSAAASARSVSGVRRAMAWCAGGMCSGAVVCCALAALRRWLATRSPWWKTATAVAVRKTSSLYQPVRHRIEMAVDGDVVVDVDTGHEPLADDKRLRRQRFELAALDRLEQRAAAALARRRKRAVVEFLDPLGERGIGLGERKQLTVAQRRQHPHLDQ